MDSMLLPLLILSMQAVNEGLMTVFSRVRDGAWNLQWADVATGQRGHLSTPSPPSVYVRYPEWAARGDVVVYERGELRGNIWLLQLR